MAPRFGSFVSHSPFQVLICTWRTQAWASSARHAMQRADLRTGTSILQQAALERQVRPYVQAHRHLKRGKFVCLDTDTCARTTKRASFDLKGVDTSLTVIVSPPPFLQELPLPPPVGRLPSRHTPPPSSPSSPLVSEVDPVVVASKQPLRCPLRIIPPHLTRHFVPNHPPPCSSDSSGTATCSRPAKPHPWLRPSPPRPKARHACKLVVRPIARNIAAASRNRCSRALLFPCLLSCFGSSRSDIRLADGARPINLRTRFGIQGSGRVVSVFVVGSVCGESRERSRWCGIESRSSKGKSSRLEKVM